MFARPPVSAVSPRVSRRYFLLTCWESTFFFLPPNDMSASDYSTLTTIISRGGFFPSIFWIQSQGSPGVPGLDPSAYHLEGTKLNESISRSWNRLTASWKAFSSARASLPEKDHGTSLTREKWLLPLFEELDYGRLTVARTVELDGRTFAISHRWNDIPIHLLGFRVGLDRRTAGAAGAARRTLMALSRTT